MSFLTKERQSVSSETATSLRRTSENLDRIIESKKDLSPVCPDGSGELGYFDAEASKWFGGGVIYSTRGPEKKYFTWSEKLKKGHLVDQKLIPAHLK